MQKQRHDDSSPVALTLLSVFVSSIKQLGPSKHFTREVTCIDDATKELCRLVTEAIANFFEAMKKKERKKKAEADAKSLFELQTALSASKVCWGPELEASLMPLREKIASVYPALRLVDPELGSLLASLLSDRLGLHPAADQEDPSDRELSLAKVRGLVDTEGDVAKAGLLRKVTVQLRQSSTRPEQLLTARLALKQINGQYYLSALTTLRICVTSNNMFSPQPPTLPKPQSTSAWRRAHSHSFSHSRKRWLTLSMPRGQVTLCWTGNQPP